MEKNIFEVFQPNIMERLGQCYCQDDSYKQCMENKLLAHIQCHQHKQYHKDTRYCILMNIWYLYGSKLACVT